MYIENTTLQPQSSLNYTIYTALTAYNYLPTYLVLSTVTAPVRVGSSGDSSSLPLNT